MESQRMRGGILLCADLKNLRYNIIYFYDYINNECSFFL